MEWQSAFRPERRVELSDIAQIIRETVTMDDVLAAYAPHLPTRRNRCPCPFHNGKDFNFSYTRYGYNCFVCGASGDVIGFVKGICELPTRSDAMKRINADLRLNLPIGATENAENSADLARKRAEREKKEAEAKAWWENYHRLMDAWVEMDRAKRTADPSSEEYADAVKSIDYVAYQLDNLPSEPR